MPILTMRKFRGKFHLLAKQPSGIEILLATGSRPIEPEPLLMNVASGLANKAGQKARPSFLRLVEPTSAA